MKSKVCLLCTTHFAFHAFVRKTHNTAANDVFQVAGPANTFCAVGSCSVSVLTLFSGRIPQQRKEMRSCKRLNHLECAPLEAEMCFKRI